MAIYIESKVGRPIRSIRPGDPGFMLQGVVTTAPRAYIELSTDCPYNYVDIIDRAYQQGWIKAEELPTGMAEPVRASVPRLRCRRGRRQRSSR